MTPNETWAGRKRAAWTEAHATLEKARNTNDALVRSPANDRGGIRDTQPVRLRPRYLLALLFHWPLTGRMWK